MQNISTASGWALDAACFLDRHSPGFAGHFLRSGGQTRHVIAAYLSRQHWLSFEMTSDRALADAEHVATYVECARFLQSATPDEIVIRAFDLEAVPTGLMGALARATSIVHEPAYYSLLRRMFSDQQSSAVRVIRLTSRKIDFDLLRVISVLDAKFHHPPLVDSLRTQDEARDFVAAWGLILERSEVTEGELLRAMRQAVRSGSLAGFLTSFAMKIAFPTNPIPDGERYKSVKTGDDLNDVARRFRNCSRNYFTQLADGQCALAEFQPCRGKTVLIMLRRSGARVYLDGVHGMRNEHVPSGTRREAEEFVFACGIEPKLRGSKAGPWGALRRLGAIAEAWIEVA